MSITFLPQTDQESLLFLQQNGTFFCHQTPLLEAKDSQILPTKNGQYLLFARTKDGQGLLIGLLPNGALGQKQMLRLPPEAMQSDCCFLSQSTSGTRCYFLFDQQIFSTDFTTTPKVLAQTAPGHLLRLFDPTHPVLSYRSARNQQMIFLAEEGQTVLLSNDGDAVLDYSALWLNGVLHLCYLYGTEQTARLYYRQVKDGVAEAPQLLYTASSLHLTALYCSPQGLFISASGQNRLLYTFSQTGGKSFFPVSRHYAPFAASQKATCYHSTQWGECYASADGQLLDSGFFRPSQTQNQQRLQQNQLQQTIQKKDQTIRALQTELNRQKQAEQNVRTQWQQQSAQWNALRSRLEQEILSLQQQHQQQQRQPISAAAPEGVILAAGRDISPAADETSKTQPEPDSTCNEMPKTQEESALGQDASPLEMADSSTDTADF